MQGDAEGVDEQVRSQWHVMDALPNSDQFPLTFRGYTFHFVILFTKNSELELASGTLNTTRKGEAMSVKVYRWIASSKDSTPK